MIRLPEKVGSHIRKVWKERALITNDEEEQELYRKVSIILGTYLGEIDKQIEELTQ